MKPGRSVVVAVCVGVIWTLTLCAAEPRQPWQWTLEERIAARLDPTANAERDRVYKEDHAAQLNRMKHQPTPNPAGTVLYRIDGKRNPELYFPHELFDGLMPCIDPDVGHRERCRSDLGPRLSQFGYDADALWRTLELFASDYGRLRSRMLSHTGERPSTQEICRQRWNALEASRARFGRENFDRMLYEVVAPGMQSSGASSSRETWVRVWRDAESGCR